MSTIDAFHPDARSEAEEHLRNIAKDFQITFGTTQGERVLSHILNELCQANKVMRPRVSGAQMELTGDNALYFSALRDLAVEIRHLLDMEFRDDPKPIVRHNRFTSRPAGRN